MKFIQRPGRYRWQLSVTLPTGLAMCGHSKPDEVSSSISVLSVLRSLNKCNEGTMTKAGTEARSDLFNLHVEILNQTQLRYTCSKAENFSNVLFHRYNSYLKRFFSDSL